jgi:hypothetical protein
LTLVKNRFGSKTGPAGKLYFDMSTFLITEVSPEALPPLEVNNAL